MARDTYYWCASGKTFGRDIGFGEKMPADFDEDRAKDYLAKGLISKKKPESITDAQLNSLEELKAENTRLLKENAALEKKVVDLEVELENLTEPDSKGGKK